MNLTENAMLRGLIAIPERHGQRVKMRKGEMLSVGDFLWGIMPEIDSQLF